MKKRWVPVLLVAAMILGTAGACDPPPPPGWVPPEVIDLVVSPTPVVPGEPFTVSATVIEDRHITAVEVRFVSPNSEVHHFCEVPTFDPSGDPQTRVELAMPCVMPDFALNGTWQVSLTAYDGEYSGHGGGGGGASTTFEAVGGTNDVAPPVVEEITLSPAPPLQGQPFEVTVRVSDDHLIVPSAYAPLAYTNTHLRTWACTAGPAVLLSPTEQEFDFTCPGVPELAAGPYELRFHMGDLNGNRLWHTAPFEIVDP